MPSDAQVKRWATEFGEMVLYADHARIVAELSAVREQLVGVYNMAAAHAWRHYGTYRAKQLVFDEDHLTRIAAALTPPQQEQGAAMTPIQQYLIGMFMAIVAVMVFSILMILVEISTQLDKLLDKHESEQEQP